MSRCRTVVIALAAVVALAFPAAAGAAAAPPPAGPGTPYLVEGVDSAAERTQVARSGVDVLASRPGRVEVRATEAQVQQLRADGFSLVPLPPAAPALPLPRAGQFPPGFTGYHTYDEMNAELTALAAEHPETVALSGYGTSFEGRQLPLVKISDAETADEDEPEVLFTCAQHAREHLTVEMCLHIAERLAADPALVADREVWLMPMVNPDGAEYDIATGAFVLWRKNRQPNPGSPAVGTDLNRNWGTQWGCCNGSSPEPAALDYRGPGPFSARRSPRSGTGWAPG